MSDQVAREEHLQRELRDTREALNAARREIAELRTLVGERTSAMLLKPPGAMVFDHAIGTAYRV